MPFGIHLIHTEPGWTGALTRDQAEGAWANGTRVMKTKQDPGGDFTKPGALGTVLGSLHAPQAGYAYFIEWDHAPKVAAFCVAAKLAVAS